MKKKLLLALRTVVCLVLILALAAGMMTVNNLVSTYARMMDSIMGGFDRSVDNSKANTEGLDLQYNKPDYTADTIGAAEDDLANRIAAEGVVLLENRDGTLPLAANTTFSFVSVNAAKVSAGGGLMGGGVDLKTLFQNAGVGINETLWSFYTEGAGSGYGLGTGSINYGDAEDFRINECPLSVMRSADGVLESMDGTVPVYFLKRVAGEGRDMPRSMYSHADSAEDKARTYIEPDSTELEILDYLNEHFDTVILVVNSNAALELDWVKDYPSIKSVLFAPDGLQALPGILTGAINPSGRTVDTFAADAPVQPAVAAATGGGLHQIHPPQRGDDGLIQQQRQPCVDGALHQVEGQKQRGDHGGHRLTGLAHVEGRDDVVPQAHHRRHGGDGRGQTADGPLGGMPAPVDEGGRHHEGAGLDGVHDEAVDAGGGDGDHLHQVHQHGDEHGGEGPEDETADDDDHVLGVIAEEHDRGDELAYEHDHIGHGAEHADGGGPAGAGGAGAFADGG